MAYTSQPNYTLTYDHGRVAGWPSFYSYYPDWMLGMNNYFYTWKGGNLYRHNVDETRNNFYGAQYSSTITSVFNDAPLDNKLFKTIALQGSHAWNVSLESDIQDSGVIDYSYFERKEHVWFAFVRNSGSTPANESEFELRSVNGLANSVTVDSSTPSAVEVNFDTSVDLSRILSNPVGPVNIADRLYFGTTPTLCGQITSVNIDLPNGINQLVVDTTVASGNIPPSNVEYFFYMNNAIAESHGILGHYGRFRLTNGETEHVELFMVQSDAMKSYP